MEGKDEPLARAKFPKRFLAFVDWGCTVGLPELSKLEEAAIARFVLFASIFKLTLWDVSKELVLYSGPWAQRGFTVGRRLGPPRHAQGAVLSQGSRKVRQDRLHREQ